jgi:hypothetical protein
MVEITYQMMLSTLQTIALIVGIVYYITIMRNNQRSRRTEMFMQLYHSTYNPENMQRFWQLMALDWKDYDDFMERYGPAVNPEEAALRTQSYNFYDGLGLLVRDGTVDIDTVYRMMGRRIIIVWYKFETIIKGLRIQPDPGPDYAENFEYLANEMVKMRQQRGLPLPLGRLHPTSTLLPEPET